MRDIRGENREGVLVVGRRMRGGGGCDNQGFDGKLGGRGGDRR